MRIDGRIRAVEMHKQDWQGMHDEPEFPWNPCAPSRRSMHQVMRSDGSSKPPLRYIPPQPIEFGLTFRKETPMRSVRNTCGLLLVIASLGAAPQTHVDHAGLKKLSWQLAGRASTFGEMTTFEMIGLLHEMGFHHIELVPGQSLSPDKKDVKIDPAMSDGDLDALIAKLKAVKLDIVSYGVAKFGSSEADARKVFEFAKKLKVKTIVTSAKSESLDLLDKLATEYQINIALSGTSCDNALKLIDGRSTRMTIAGEFIAWADGNDGLLASVKKAAGHVVLVHISSGDESEAAALAALRDQNFKGICCVQADGQNSTERLDRFAKNVNAFSDVVTKLAK
jgi:hypothetical protein